MYNEDGLLEDVTLEQEGVAERKEGVSQCEVAEEREEGPQDQALPDDLVVLQDQLL